MWHLTCRLAHDFRPLRTNSFVSAMTAHLVPRIAQGLAGRSRLVAADTEARRAAPRQRVAGTFESAQSE